MEDYEVRQALAIIKDRVKEIKEDDEWKQTIAKEWNEAAAEELNAKEQSLPKEEEQSVYSYSKCTCC